MNELEKALVEAADGNNDARRRFFVSLLKSSVFAAERPPRGNVSHQPEYPATPFNFLAIQSEDKVYLPIFSSEAQLREWFDRDITIRTTSFRGLLDSIPENWWVYLNPDGGTQKELSPWELARLIKGEEAIEEILHELDREIEPLPLNLRALELDEASGLRAELIKFCGEHPNITRVFLLREHKELGKIVIGLEFRGDPTMGDAYRDELSRRAQQIQIGQEPVTVIVGAVDSPELSLFRYAKPIYERKVGLMSRVLATLKRQ